MLKIPAFAKRQTVGRNFMKPHLKLKKNETMQNTFEQAFGKKRNNVKSNSLESQKITNHIWEMIDGSSIYLQFGDWNQALTSINTNILILERLYSRKLNENKDYWRIFAFKANALEELQRYEEAIEAYEYAIENSDDDISIYALYHQIGWCYLNFKNDNKAVEFYTYAIELKKQHPNTSSNEDLEGIDNGVLLGKEFKQMYINRGNSYKNIGQLQYAQNDCISAINADPNYSNPYLLLYQIYNLAGQKEKAVQFLQKSASMGNQNAMRMLNNL